MIVTLFNDIDPPRTHRIHDSEGERLSLAAHKLIILRYSDLPLVIASYSPTGTWITPDHVQYTRIEIKGGNVTT